MVATEACMVCEWVVNILWECFLVLKAFILLKMEYQTGSFTFTSKYFHRGDLSVIDNKLYIVYLGYFPVSCTCSLCEIRNVLKNVKGSCSDKTFVEILEWFLIFKSLRKILDVLPFLRGLPPARLHSAHISAGIC